MAGTAQDIQAGRAYINLYLRRTDYNRQVDDLQRGGEDNRPSAAIAGAAGESVTATNIDDIAARGVIMRVAGDAAVATLAKMGVTAAATAPALAATGTAAGGAAVGFGAMTVAALPIILPLAAVAAAATLVWVSISKWDELPLIVKGLLVVLFPLVAVVRVLVNAFKALKLAVTVVTAPIWLTVAAVRGLLNAIKATPRAIAATIGLMGRLSVAAADMAVKVTKAAVAIPGQVARATSSALRDAGTSIVKIGAMGAGIAAAIVGPATLAARSWAAYGETIRGVQNDLLKFQLTAEEASVINRVAEQTGESTERLAQQMRDGTRDFSRWRNELRQSSTMMSGPGLVSALALSRAYFSVRQSAVGLKNTIGAALGPTLTESAGLVSGVIRGVTKWVSENKPLVVQVFKVASAVGVAAGLITTMGGAIAGASTLVSPLVAWLAMLAGVMAVVETRTEAGQSLWNAYGDSVRRVVGSVMRDLGQMMAFADRVIGGVVDALMAGDLKGAVDVMWNAAKVVWVSALLEIDELTSGTFGGILASLAAGKWKTAGESIVNELTIVWTNIVGAADTAWVGVLTGFDTMVASMKTALGEFLDWARINVFAPLAIQISKVPGVDVSLGGPLLDAKAAIDRSLETPAEDRAGPLAERQAAREREITALKERQTELAKQSGEAAERERTANQKALDASIAAAEAARAAADANKLKAADFAVSQAVQSIARFSGEALGLSVGRRDGPAEKTAKAAEAQVKELEEIKKGLEANQREILRLIAQGGFA